MQPIVDRLLEIAYSGVMASTIEPVPRPQLGSVPVTIRFPADLHERLSEYAQEHGRPFTAQVIYWLRNDLEMAERGEHPKP